jgi:hypothetical protein
MHAFSTHRLLRLVIAAVALAAPLGALAADEKPASTAKSDDATHLLRYKFKPGETLRWEVEQRSQIRTTIQGTTQTAETISTSTKVWRIDRADADGKAKFTYWVESVDMRQKFDGRQELRYNSDNDKEAPPGFGDVAKQVGVPLSTVTLDALGKTVAREELAPQATPAPELITPPLPEEAVAVGGQWTTPADIKVTLRTGEVKTIKARQHYTLESVDGDVATIRLETQILSPVRDNPEIEAQIVQSKANGQIRFSIDEGRILSQQSDVDERVNGFQGEASSLHCITRFSEKLLPAGAAATKVPVAGPKAGPVAGPQASAPTAPKASAPKASAKTTGRRTTSKSVRRK